MRHGMNMTGISVIITWYVKDSMATDDKIALVLSAVREKIDLLTQGKKTCKAIVTLEANISQGTIGDIYVTESIREKHNVS